MIDVPEGFLRKFDTLLSCRRIPCGGSYRKWLRFYQDFCHKHGHAYAGAESLPPFLDKLASKGQSPALRSQAGAAVNLYYEMLAPSGGGHGFGEQSGRAEVREKSGHYRGGADRGSAAGRSGAAEATYSERIVADEAEAPRPRVDSGRGASWQTLFKALEAEIRVRSAMHLTRSAPATQ